MNTLYINEGSELGASVHTGKLLSMRNVVNVSQNNPRKLIQEVNDTVRDSSVVIREEEEAKSGMNPGESGRPATRNTVRVDSEAGVERTWFPAAVSPKVS